MRELSNQPNFTTMLSSSQIIYMSSREIAELCEKLHNNVLRDIRRMLERLGEIGENSNLSSPPNSEQSRWKFSTYTTTQNKKLTEILLDKELTVTLISGYSPLLRNRIIQRWLELENKFQHGQNLLSQVPKTLPEALRLATDLSEKVAEQEKIIQQQQTELLEVKSVLNNIVATEDCKTFTQAAKALGISRQDLIILLEFRLKWIYRKNGKIMPFMKWRQAGFLIYAMRETSLNLENPKINNYWRTFITPKWMNYLRNWFDENVDYKF